MPCRFDWHLRLAENCVYKNASNSTSPDLHWPDILFEARTNGRTASRILLSREKIDNGSR